MDENLFNIPFTKQTWPEKSIDPTISEHFRANLLLLLSIILLLLGMGLLESKLRLRPILTIIHRLKNNKLLLLSLFNNSIESIVPR